MSRIVLCYPTQTRHREKIAAAAGNAEIVDAGQTHVAKELLRGAEIYCGHATSTVDTAAVDWESVVKQGDLRWIQSSAAGLDHCLHPAVVASDIHVTSASGVISYQVAEQAIALLLGLMRGLPVYFRAQLAKEYVRRPTRDLRDSAIAILGFGGVGRRVATALVPFEARVTAFDLFPVDPLPGVELRSAEEFDRTCADFDAVIICLPLTDPTRGMFNSHRLGQLKPGALLLNVARGPIVVEKDLIDALKSNHLSGAGLDVAETEPLPADSGLWKLPNVIITPHVGGQSARRPDDMTDFFCENLRRYFGGEPLLNYVDKQLGFTVRSRQQEQPRQR